MIRSLLQYVVFLAGLAVLCWVATGYAGSNPLALAVTLLIGVVYLAGAVELQRYRSATTTLARAIDGVTTTAPSHLDDWLGAVPVGLRQPVRLRLQGVRAALPGPTLAPYLAGLLVLLGMLGTFLGMIATLRGTSLALQTGTDLQAIRDSLAAPVNGLGFAFGTSVAGVATSAALGLLSALCRGDRLQTAMALDGAIATSLRGFSQANVREESLKLMQRQADVLPVLADRMQAMLTAMETQAQTLNAQLAASHERLSTRLASDLTSLSDRLSANQATANTHLATNQEAIHQHLVAAQEALHQRLGSHQDAFQAQAVTAYAQLTKTASESLHALQSHAETSYSRWSDAATQAVQDGAQASARAAGLAIEPAVQATLASMASEALGWRDTLTQSNREQIGELARAFAQTTSQIRDSLAQTSALLTQNFATATTHAADHLAQTTTQVSERLEGHTQALVERETALLDHLAQAQSQRDGQLAARDEQRVAELARQLDTHAAVLREGWAQTQALAADQHQQLCDTLARTAENISTQTATQTTRTLTEVTRLLQAVEATPASVSEQINAHAALLREGWTQTHALAADQHQQLCDTLARTADSIAAQAEARTERTLADVARVMQAVEAAPLAVAEVIGELRRKQSEGLARDNAILEERAQMLETVHTLLDTVNQAATRQHETINALITSSSEELSRIGERFAQMAQAQASHLVDAATVQAEKLATVTAAQTEKLADVAAAQTEKLASVAAAQGDKLTEITQAQTDKLTEISVAQADKLIQVTQAESGKLAEIAGSITEGTAQTVALGESLSAALQSFSTSNTALAEQLQQIQGALEQSMARSDEQLAYYVAQAREVVDLSLLSQKQILEDLQRVAKT